MLIKPLTLGKLVLSNNLIQGPLAGYSCAPFRLLTYRYGQPAYCVTEMISAKDLIRQPVKPKRYLWKDPAEGLVCYQLSGNEPSELAEAAKIVTDYGADLIDLNCGCPVTKIRAKNCGSRLLAQPQKLAGLVAAIKASTPVPVSVKIRVDSASGDNNNLSVAKAIADAGADLLIVHGRHWTERYDVPCNLDQIAEIAAAVSIPVIGNGDVENAASLKQMLLYTGCAGTMIARAGVGQPWLFQQLAAELNGQILLPPSNQVVGEIFLEHIQRLADLESEYIAVLQSRKLAKYYIRQRFDSLPFQQALNTATSLYAIEQLIRHYFVS